MHFSIPLTQELPDSFGGRYVLYSVYLEGLLCCRVRYSDLLKWNDKLRQTFGSIVPPFPPKFYLAMTKALTDDRRLQLERYLQNVAVNPIISSSDTFAHYFRDLQLDTFRIQERRANLDVYLPNGRKIRLNVQTSDSAERVLEVVSHKLELSRDMIEYFSLFLIQHHITGNLSVLKRLVEFELPYVTISSMKDESVILEIRKWYMDPSLDKMLFDSQASVGLLSMQALLEIDQQWSRPTKEQLEKLQNLQKEGHYIKFLELMQDVQQYGCMQLDLCTIDYPEPDTSAVVSVGNAEIHCSLKVANKPKKEIAFKISRIRCWQVTFLAEDLEDGGQTNEQKCELKFEYNRADSWRWITIYTKQAFLLSTCLTKMLSEGLLMHTKEHLEMQIEVPAMTKAKKSNKPHPTVDSFGSIIRKSKISSEGNESSNFPDIRDADL